MKINELSTYDSSKKEEKNPHTVVYTFPLFDNSAASDIFCKKIENLYN